MNFFKRSERLEMIEGQLCRIVTAYGRDKAHQGEMMDVYQHFENGQKAIRNIEYNGSACGWLIAWPGYTYTTICRGYNCGSYTAEIDPWCQTIHDLNGFSYHHPTDKEKQLILQKYPEFKWIFKKANLTTEEIFHILPEWKKHPQQVEALLGAGYETLALNKSIYKLKNARPILEWLRQHPNNKFITLGEIQKCIKWNICLDELHKYEDENMRQCSLPYDCWKHMHTNLLPAADHCETRTTLAHHYKDYLEMAKKAGHSIKDKYWRFPKDLLKAHKKVMKECQLIDELKQKAAREQQQKDYTAAIKKMMGKNFESGKIQVFIPETIEQIEKQAEALEQCLIRCNYIDKVIKGERWLVFVQKAGKPYATCELIRNGKKLKVGQFYGDERKKNYLAKPDAKEAFNAWAKQNKVKVAA